MPSLLKRLSQKSQNTEWANKLVEATGANDANSFRSELIPTTAQHFKRSAKKKETL
jgi:hypothetical protein